MKKPLLDVIIASEKRKDVLLLLDSVPQEMETILSSLDTTRQALIPQIRILEEHYLVTGSDDIYELTTVGRLVLDELSTLLGTVETLDSDIDYWGTHKLEFIPPNLMKRISELGKCNAIVPPIIETHEMLREFHSNSKESKVLYSINTYFHPNFAEMFDDLLENDVSIYFLLSQDLLDDLEDNHRKKFRHYLNIENFNFYLHPENLGFMSLGLNKHYLMLTSLRKDGNFDNKRLLCSSPGAWDWEKELFDHYLKESFQLSEDIAEKLLVSESKG